MKYLWFALDDHPSAIRFIFLSKLSNCLWFLVKIALHLFSHVVKSLRTSWRVLWGVGRMFYRFIMIKIYLIVFINVDFRIEAKIPEIAFGQRSVWIIFLIPLRRCRQFQYRAMVWWFSHTSNTSIIKLVNKFNKKK